MWLSREPAQFLIFYFNVSPTCSVLWPKLGPNTYRHLGYTVCARLSQTLPRQTIILTNLQEGCLFAMFTLLATEEEPKLRAFN